MPSSNSTTVKKSETCEEQLRRMCKTIAQELTDGKTKKGDNIYYENVTIIFVSLEKNF